MIRVRSKRPDDDIFCANSWRERRPEEDYKSFILSFLVLN